MREDVSVKLTHTYKSHRTWCLCTWRKTSSLAAFSCDRRSDDFLCRSPPWALMIAFIWRRCLAFESWEVEMCHGWDQVLPCDSVGGVPWWVPEPSRRLWSHHTWLMSPATWQLQIQHETRTAYICTSVLTLQLSIETRRSYCREFYKSFEVTYLLNRIFIFQMLRNSYLSVFCICSEHILKFIIVGAINNKKWLL